MSILGILDIGRTALAAQKAAIEVTGQNIANVNTPGYSRQTAVLETAPGGQDQGIGNGVFVASIQRSYDRFLQSQINDKNSASGEQTTEQAALQRMQPLFNDLAAEGLSGSLQKFFSAWQDLSMNPQGEAERQSVLAKAQTLMDNFHQISNSLTTVKQDANQSLGALTNDINNKTKQIAALNIQIMQAEQNNGSANTLRDSRDLLLKDLAGKVGIHSFEQPDGMVTVSLARGPVLVEGNRSATLDLQADAANSGLYGIMLTAPGGAAGSATDVTSIIAESGSGSGELGGTLRVRDNLVNGFAAGLDELASTLAVKVNGLHAAGFALNGTTGVDFFTPPPAPVPPATIAAGFSAGIALNVTTTAGIAAASTDPTLAGNGTGNNVNSLAIADLKNLTLTMSGGKTTLTGFYGSLVGKVGLAVQSSQQNGAQNSAMLKQLNMLRESTSGVSLDEELTGMIRYQKAFQGAAHLITTGQQMMDTVLNMVR